LRLLLQLQLDDSKNILDRPGISTAQEVLSVTQGVRFAGPGESRARVIDG
jgi:hypothetical protein